MKKKNLLLTASMLCLALTTQAQYMIIEDMPIPEPKLATSASEYGFYANWNPVLEDPTGQALGYYLRTYVSTTAKEDGQRFYYMNTDFSFLQSEGTEEAPLTNVSESNMFVQEGLGLPNRNCWTVLNPGYVDGELCLNGAYNYIACNGQFALAISDLSVGGGVVHVKLRIKGDGTTSKFRVLMRDCDNLNYASNTLDAKDIDVTTEWQDVEFTLQGGAKNSDLLFMGNEMGNQTGMYYFIDDMQVWQELKKGETARALCQDKFIINDLNHTQEYISTNDLADGEDYLYTISTYGLEGISPESKWVTVGRDGTEPRIIDPGTASDIRTIGISASSNETSIHTVSGELVAKGNANAVSQLPQGLYIVKQGNHTTKVLKR